LPVARELAPQFPPAAERVYWSVIPFNNHLPTQLLKSVLHALVEIEIGGTDEEDFGHNLLF